MKGGERAQQQSGTIAAALFAVAACLVGLLLQFHPMLLSKLARMPGDWGDARLNNYILEHGYRWVTGMPGHESFWNPPVFFPAFNTAAYSDVLLGVAPFYWLWRVAGFQPDTAFQLWVLTIGVLNFSAAFVLFRRGFRCQTLGAATGAMLLSFAAIRTSQVMHAQLIEDFYIMIAILAVIEIFTPTPELRAGITTVEPRAKWVFALAAACVAQLYSSYYYGWFLGFGLMLATILALALPASRRRLFATVRANALALGLAAALAVLLLAPLAVHYLRVERELGVRGFNVVEQMLPRLQSWMYLGGDSWLYGRLATYAPFHSLPLEHEHRLGLGVATMVCAVIGLWMARNRRDVQLVTIVPLAMAVLATEWPGRFSAWHAVYALVPGAAALRAVSRIGFVVLIPAALGIALLIDALARPRRIPPSRTAAMLRRTQRRQSAIFVAAVVATIVAEQVQEPRSFDKLEGRARVARVASGIGAQCGAFLYTTIHGADDPWNYHLDAMWASMERNVPTINGYSGNQPLDWSFYDIRVHTPAQDSIVSDSLSQWAARRHIDPARICRVRTPPG